jgi:predicted Fe-Mo cluster-binding NifX family protein
MKQIAIASEDDRGLEAVVSAHFGRCPFYTMVEVDGTRVVKHRVEANPHIGQHRPGQMPRFIHSLGADVILAGGMGPMAVDLFHGFGMDVATGVSGTVGEAVDAYTGGRLQGIVPCNHDHPESCGGHDQAQTHEEAHPPKRSVGVSPRSLPSRVVVPAQDNSGLSAVMDPRFGRAPWFIVVDVESGQVMETLSNSNADAAHGAGTGAAALMAQSGVQAVIAGRFGTKAQQALQALGVEMWSAPEGLTVGQIVERLRAGQLSRSE